MSEKNFRLPISHQNKPMTTITPRLSGMKAAGLCRRLSTQILQKLENILSGKVHP
jgi:hypothetical protein